ncbi:hypothetical protein ACFQH6_11020 [Halobacteriaceae archaeon GCM10025711]
MTTDEALPNDDGAQATDAPTDAASFNAALQRLLRAAHRNDVPIRGAWQSRNEETDIPDWDIQITEVKKPDVVER